MYGAMNKHLRDTSIHRPGAFVSRRFGIALSISICLMIFFLFQLPSAPSTLLRRSEIFIQYESVTPPPTPPIRSKEAYVTFLSDVHTEPWYGIQTQLLIFQFKHDPLTADPDRDFVVLTTPRVPDAYQEMLRTMGAIVEQRPFIEDMPGMDRPDANPTWRDQYCKLYLFDMTEYERVLYLDNDYTIAKSFAGIWDDPSARLDTGLASNPFNDQWHSHPPDSTDNIFNGGFWMAKPNRTMFEELLQVTGYDTWTMEQSLLNHYFADGGDHPWARLDRIWSAQWAQPDDIRAGSHGLHEKVWQHTWRGEIERPFTEWWRQKLGRMEGYWLAKFGISQIAIPIIETPDDVVPETARILEPVIPDEEYRS